MPRESPLDKQKGVRGSQYASEVYRELLAAHGLAGSMSRRGNPYDCESVGAAWRA
jgi:hypothetical protein